MSSPKKSPSTVHLLCQIVNSCSVRTPNRTAVLRVEPVSLKQEVRAAGCSTPFRRARSSLAVGGRAKNCPSAAPALQTFHVVHLLPQFVCHLKVLGSLCFYPLVQLCLCPPAPCGRAKAPLLLARCLSGRAFLRPESRGIGSGTTSGRSRSTTSRFLPPTRSCLSLRTQTRTTSQGQRSSPTRRTTFIVKLWIPQSTLRLPR